MWYVMTSMISVSLWCAMICYDLHGFYYLVVFKIYNDPYNFYLAVVCCNIPVAVLKWVIPLRSLAEPLSPSLVTLTWGSRSTWFRGTSDLPDTHRSSVTGLGWYFSCWRKKPITLELHTNISRASDLGRSMLNRSTDTKIGL